MYLLDTAQPAQQAAVSTAEAYPVTTPTKSPRLRLLRAASRTRAGTADEAAGGAWAAACRPPATSNPPPPLQTAATREKATTAPAGLGTGEKTGRHSMDPATSGLRRVVSGEFIAFRPSSLWIYPVCSRWHLQI